jgi:hypothetical protein
MADTIVPEPHCTRVKPQLSGTSAQGQPAASPSWRLAKTAPAADDPALLEELPLAADILAGLPPALKARLLAEKNVKHSQAITAYKLFGGRSHYTCGEDGWEQVADLALDWALAPTSGDLDQR